MRGAHFVAHPQRFAAEDTFVCQYGAIVSSKFRVALFKFFPFLDASLPRSDRLRVTAVYLLPAAGAVFF
ncbi:hypothetical protein AUT26_08445 [[Arthrobacter] sp. ATCC 21022]|nr:hypothetical protein AUT26_08445 [Arthrobacter sp. ATCC 21022]KUR63451.1 hypothetical protein JM67_17045 [Arthrobacter sp. ATCC 21022]